MQWTQNCSRYQLIAGRLNPRKFLNTEVPQKYWNEAVTVITTHNGGNRSNIALPNITITWRKISSLQGAVLCAGCWLTQREGQCSGGRPTPAPWPPSAACQITMIISLKIIKMERSVQHDPYRGFINVLTSGTPGICVHERRSVCFINVQNVQLYIMLCYSDS